jgi:hypothetical protein
MRKTNFRILHLPRTSFVPQMLRHFVDHTDASVADAMAEGFQTAGRIDRNLTTNRRPTLFDVAPAFPLLR